MAKKRSRKDGVGRALEEAEKLQQSARRADSNPQLVATAKALRRLLPGDESVGERGAAATAELPPHLQRVFAKFEPKRPSTARELGLAAVQAWQALSEAQRRGRGKADVAILFTDLVGFSDWALKAGDEPAVALLRAVAAAEEEAISAEQGEVVKRLGDGAMAVFGRADQAVRAALDAQKRAKKIEIDGYVPKLRAGVHVGRPRKVRDDFLGVDVNIAARVGEAAEGGQVLASDSAREALDPEQFNLGRRRALAAPGAPTELCVCTARARSARARKAAAKPKSTKSKSTKAR